jgi:hypothetical protein
MSLRNLLISVLFLSAASCASDSKISELPSTANPQQELQKLDADLALAEQNQINILSPEHFEAAVKARESAVKARSSDKKQSDILHELSVSKDHLKTATQTSQISYQILREPIQARKDSITAKGHRNLPIEFAKADSKMN